MTETGVSFTSPPRTMVPVRSLIRCLAGVWTLSDQVLHARDQLGTEAHAASATFTSTRVLSRAEATGL
jgi:hypothetical protein